MIGKITMTAGGTTRNTAECLGRLGLGAETLFVSGVGDDMKSHIVKQSLAEVGVSDEGLCIKKGE